MSRTVRIAILASLASCLVTTAATAQSSRADQAASWQTTTTRLDRPESWEPMIERAPVPRRTSAKPVTTGALPANKMALTNGSAAGTSHTLAGIASFYWQDQKTASGERFDKMAMTAAHKTLPFGTRVRVTNTSNGQAVVVRINDRGPFKGGRVIDLSYAAAGIIGMRDKGLAPVRLQVVN